MGSLPIMLTGDRPTGCLHLGHYVGSLANRLLMQSNYDSFIMIADCQAMTDHYDHPEMIQQHILSVAKDYLAVGLSPQHCTFFVQSHIPQLFELTIFFMNLVSVSRLERNPTIKQEIQQKGMEQSVPAGFLCYPVSQAADIALFKAKYIPVGDDQLPILEQTNEITRRFNRLYRTEIFEDCEPVLSTEGRLVGIDGKAKASKSLNNAIFLSDSPEILKQKVMSMYTDPNHLRVSDPGQVEGNAVFAYLDAFYSDKEHLKELKKHYAQGGLGDMVLKKLLLQVLSDFLDPIAQKRAALKDEEVLEILDYGSQVARRRAAITIEQVRSAMGLGRRSANLC